jgi:hypothetical protein
MNIYTQIHQDYFFKLIEDWVMPDDWFDDIYEGATLTGAYGGVTSTSWEKGNVPWTKGKTKETHPQLSWSEERKLEQSKRAKETHKRLGHVEGGKPYEYKGHARVDNTTELNKQILECPHCNKTGNLGNMKRWHFDNCGKKRTFVGNEDGKFRSQRTRRRTS